MTAKPKPWPYEAANARDRAAEAAIEGINQLEPLMAELNDEKLRRIARTLLVLYRIARLLESAGAKTRP